MNAGDPQAEANRKEALKLARKAADAYVKAAPSPEPTDTEKALLVLAIAERFRQGLGIGLTHLHLGGYAGSAVENWEASTGRADGPHHFEIDAYGEVRTLTGS